jgi:hypothetical protein
MSEKLRIQCCIGLDIRALRCVRAEGDETRVGRSRAAVREMRLDREAQRALLPGRVERALDLAHELFLGPCRSRRADAVRNGPRECAARRRAVRRARSYWSRAS